jgi:AcrR family transcriptional regulator
MPKPSGRNRDLYEATHARILESARTLFAARGYDHVTTPEVAAAAGVSHGSLFHHFPTKRDLFAAVHDGYQLELIGRIDAAAAAAPDPAARFDAIWRAYLDSTADPAMRRILLLDGPRVIGLEALRARDRETAFAFFTGELAALQAAGLIRAGSVRALAVLLFGALDQAAFEIADFPDDAELRRALVDEVAALVSALRPRG